MLYACNKFEVRGMQSEDGLEVLLANRLHP